jgi:hypothetical protein
MISDSEVVTICFRVVSQNSTDDTEENVSNQGILSNNSTQKTSEYHIHHNKLS